MYNYCLLNAPVDESSFLCSARYIHMVLLQNCNKVCPLYPIGVPYLVDQSEA